MDPGTLTDSSSTTDARKRLLDEGFGRQGRRQTCSNPKFPRHQPTCYVPSLAILLVIKPFSCVPSLHLQPTGTTSAEQAEIQQLLAEENVEVLTEEDRDCLTQLDSLTGVPRGDDVLLFALPMCAPYQVCSGTCLLQRA